MQCVINILYSVSVMSQTSVMEHFHFYDDDYNRCHFYSCKCDNIDPQSKAENSFQCRIWFRASAILICVQIKDKQEYF